MIRTVVPRPIRVGTALAGVAGIVTLAGCASGAADAEPAGSSAAGTPSAVASPSASTSGSADAGESTGAYKDGTYTAEGSYSTPETVEKIEVTITLEDDTVTAVEVTGDPQAAETRQYQGQFVGGISDAVVGKKIDELQVSKVAGSSLTSGGFNKALDAIKAEAAS